MPADPSAAPAAAECSWCAKQHAIDFLCEPARELLAAIRARGDALNMPTIEFDEPVNVDGLEAYLVAGWNATAACVDVAGVPRPAILLTPTLLSGPAPHGFLYPATDDGLRDFRDLIDRLVDMAIRAAETKRRAS